MSRKTHRHYRIPVVFITLISLIIIGATLRFTNLNWGNPWHFHPDERNIAAAV